MLLGRMASGHLFAKHVQIESSMVLVSVAAGLLVKALHAG